MEISKNYEYRTDFSRTTYGVSQTVTIDDNLPSLLVHAESLLLAARVRYLINVEVFHSQAFPDNEYAIKEINSLRLILKEATKCLQDVCRPKEGSGVEPYDYQRYGEFALEVTIIMNFIRTALAELQPPQVATV